MEIKKDFLEGLVSMLAANGAVADELRMQMANAELAAAKNRDLPAATANQKWVTAKGEETTVGAMHDFHVRNALAKIMRELADCNKVAYVNKDGRITFAERLRYVIDGQNTFIDEEGAMNSYPQGAKERTEEPHTQWDENRTNEKDGR